MRGGLTAAGGRSSRSSSVHSPVLLGDFLAEARLGERLDALDVDFAQHGDDAVDLLAPRLGLPGSRSPISSNGRACALPSSASLRALAWERFLSIVFHLLVPSAAGAPVVSRRKRSLVQP